MNLLAAVAGVAFAALGILGEVAGFNAAAVGLAAGTPATASVPTTVPAPPSTTATFDDRCLDGRFLGRRR